MPWNWGMLGFSHPAKRIIVYRTGLAAFSIGPYWVGWTSHQPKLGTNLKVLLFRLALLNDSSFPFPPSGTVPQNMALEAKSTNPERAEKEGTACFPSSTMSCINTSFSYLGSLWNYFLQKKGKEKNFPNPGTMASFLLRRRVVSLGVSRTLCGSSPRSFFLFSLIYLLFRVKFFLVYFG